jgi:4-amino-4-deoxy-L-arabinose transferase-like glycosyltransferase
VSADAITSPPESAAWSGALRSGLILLLLWVLAVLAGLLTRSMIPVDELRYADVAWEMWSQGHWLVPTLNGVPYSDKPPLFFWLVHAAWSCFGVSAGVTRMVAPVLTLLDLVLCAWLGRLLWPRQPGIARAAPWVLLSCVFLTGYCSWVQIDLLLVACSLLALCGVALAGNGRPAGWALAGIGLGLGLLAKGPVVLLPVLPVAWLAPYWLETEAHPRWRAWYAGSLGSLLLAAVIGLAWAIPAARAGGEAYRNAIFWGQTAHRVVDSFAHAHPVWWYLPWLLVLFSPWVLLPWLWSATRAQWHRRDRGLRFCATWILSVLLLLSLVSGKQAKYLLPLLPGFALLVSRVLDAQPERPVTQRPWLLAAVLALFGVAGMAAPYLLHQAPWLNRVSPVWGGLLVGLAALTLWLPAATPQQYPPRMLVLSVCAILIGEVGVLRIGAPAYDLKAASALIARVQSRGHPVAVTGLYHGQFGFYGRLTRPLQEVAVPQLADWVRTHPGGYVVLTGRESGAGNPGVVYHQPYQGGYLAIAGPLRTGSDLAQLPGLPPLPQHEPYRTLR